MASFGTLTEAEAPVVMLPAELWAGGYTADVAGCRVVAP